MIEVRAEIAVFSCKTEYILQLFKQQALVTFIRVIGLFHQLSKINPISESFTPGL